jgi:hypothetical protein
MKKISRLAALFVLLASFSAPFFASAAISCPIGCSPGTLNPNQCVDAGGEPCATSGGGINLGVITPYSNGIINFINSILVPVLFAIAFIVFLWGVFKYFILGAADEKSRTDGKQFVLWGLIGFVVILSVWGIVTIVGQTLGLQLGGAAPFKPPTL